MDVAFLAVDVLRLSLAIYSGNAAAIQSAAVDTAISAAGVLNPIPLSGQAAKAAVYASRSKAATEGVAGARGVASRPSEFRKQTIQDAWDNAAPGSKPGTKACPTCTRDLEVGPGIGKRDWDVDHQPKWSERDLSNKTRKEVLDEYNRDVRARCPSCNRGAN